MYIIRLNTQECIDDAGTNYNAYVDPDIFFTEDGWRCEVFYCGCLVVWDLDLLDLN